MGQMCLVPEFRHERFGYAPLNSYLCGDVADVNHHAVGAVRNL